MKTELPVNQIICGNALEVLKTFQDESVHCCVTSPPYWNLRDYGVEGQIGLEKTPDEYVEKIVEIFREVRRTLRPDGNAWLNLGDSYFGSGMGYGDTKTTNKNHIGSRERRKPMWRNCGLKPKDLCGIPWRVALALQADGWYLRQDIIWHKPNPMPESVADRCTKSHEYLFHLTKSAYYFYDAEAIKEKAVETNDARPRMGQGTNTIYKSKRGYIGKNQETGLSPQHHGQQIKVGGMKNKRSVWTIPTHAFPEAHFATFPPALVEPCILAGCPKDGIALDPFMGSGTVAVVAYKLNRNYIGIELNPKYIEIAERRIKKTQDKFALFEKEARKGQKSLFETGGGL